MKVYINDIKFNRSLVDGPGVRTIVFFQGCDIHCKGCHNKSTWNMLDGKCIEVSELAKILKKNVVNKKITLSGGEPLMQKDALEELLNMLEGYDIALYTGHEIEDVPNTIIEKIKYLKTGPFVEELKTTVKPYVGSKNQEFRRINHAKVQ